LDDQKYWLAFSLVPLIGTKRILQLKNHFGDLATAWKAPEHALIGAQLGEQAIDNIVTRRREIDPDRELTKVHAAQAHLLTLNDPEYPRILKEIDSPPSVLYVRGKLDSKDDLALSVVGTRKATKYGRDVAYSLSRELAQQTITIISGMALGVDSAAHNGALDAGGRTIAIFGCGIDLIYPRENRELAQRIVDNGAIISEFPIGTQPVATNFPRRNRILSGLALGVLVVEAPENSGALITASFAADQGREVFAVPSNIFNRMGRGANRLIQDGAKLVMDVNDILNELNIVHENVQIRERTESVVPSNSAEMQLLEHLNADPIHIDDLARLCDLPIAQVSSTLTILELKGVAQMVGHMQYSRVYRP
jgi:DNA processing protein